ncbi:MAG: UDP-N-acetylmuramoyl-L-alanine--D-glutamate ligase [Acidimicrobiales bacterium]
MPETALVVGMGASGAAAARHLHDRGARIVAVDDAPGDEARAAAARLGLELVEAPDVARLADLLVGADVVVPSPGVPLAHPVFGLAAEHGVPVRGEVELAFRWTHHPVVAVTGTNGKTTVTALTTEMLTASGVRAIAGGNIGLPLSEAVRRDVDVVVAEVSSFQLRWTDTFCPQVGVWLNVAEDHLDWHPGMDDYVAAKSRIWAHQGSDNLAVANADDPVVAAAARSAPGRVEAFSVVGEAHWRVARGALWGPPGRIVDVSELPRALPHDLANAMAAAAAALGAGATVEGVRAALRGFPGLPHRLTLVAHEDGIGWYDDSKATNPHATLAALYGLSSVVLIAGGRNKGLHLGVLRQGSHHLRAVVAMGEAAPEVASVFDGVCPVTTVSSMDEAVAAARAGAMPGDTVLLSPGCASFDQYPSYAARGDDFARAVITLVGLRAPAVEPSQEEPGA